MDVLIVGAVLAVVFGGCCWLERRIKRQWDVTQTAIGAILADIPPMGPVEAERFAATYDGPERRTTRPRSMRVNRFPDVYDGVDL